MSVTLEWASEEDITRLSQLFLEDMKDLGHSPAPDAMIEMLTVVLTESRERVYLRLARDEEGQVIGVLLANAFHSIKFPGKAWWIEELYVDPSARRKGVGRKLVEDLLNYSKDNGFGGIELEAYRMNTAASILYRSLGFRRLARERYTFDLAEWE